MADIYTHLRELGVGFYFFNSENDFENINPSLFLMVCKNNILGCENLTISQIAKNKDNFDKIELKIIKNAYNLGEKIKNNFKISEHPQIIWTGLQTQSKSVIDLFIDKIPFSLKEESFILENMGLYKLLNILTNSDKFEKGVHIFEEFSLQELEQWFQTTRDLLIKIGPKRFDASKKDKYQAKASLKDNVLLMYYKDKNKDCAVTIENFDKLDYKLFKMLTNSTIREKVFSKWIKSKVEKEKRYIEAKKVCAIKAGERLVHFVGNIENTSPESLKRFFRIQEEKYYYAKTTANSIEIYKVPSDQKASKEIVISKIDFDVPKSQLNFFTKIKNMKTDKIITFRNELRYSHGQFNGTPEAKSYIKNGELAAMYEKII